MGTTESIFYDNDDNNNSDGEGLEAAVIESAAASVSSNGDRSSRGGGGGDGIAHSRSAGMSRKDGPSPSVASRQWQEGAYPNRRSVIPSEATLSARRAQPTLRRHADDNMPKRHRANGNRPTTKAFRRIEGWLGGSTQTGKRSLLMRLQGRDPFPLSPTPRTSDSSSDSLSDRDQSIEDTITVPYRPPEGCHSLDKIQLHIKNMSKIITASKNDDDGRLPDFAVILINPLDDDLGSVHNYVYQAVIQYAARLGYGTGNNQNYDNESDTEEKDDNGRNITNNDNSEKQKNKKKLLGSKKPLCLCLVWNFRDLLNDKRHNSMYTERRDLLVQFVQNSLKSLGVLPNQSRIVCIETSMKNCYGLDRLHQFIYRSYLELKRHELHSMLRDVEDQMEALDEKEDEMYRNDDSYNEFLTVLSSTLSTTPSEGKTQKSSSQSLLRHENEKISSKEEARAPSKTKTKTIEKNHQDTRSTKNSANGDPTATSSQRTVIHTNDQTKKDKLASKVGQDALEAFLASSSDEEDVPASSKKRDSKTRNVLNAKSGPFYAYAADEDDDDDDFFYDAAGRQHAHQGDDSSNSNDSSLHVDPDSSFHSGEDSVKSIPVDASESHNDEDKKSVSSDLDDNDRKEIHETLSGHHQAIETVECDQNVANVIHEDENLGAPNPAMKKQAQTASSEDSTKETELVDDRQIIHQSDEECSQSSPPKESESGQVNKSESFGSEVFNGSENDIQGSLDDGSDLNNLKQARIMSNANGPTEAENYVNTQSDDSDESAYMISTDSDDQDEQKMFENQCSENETLAENEIVHTENLESGGFEEDTTGTNPHFDSVNGTTARCAAAKEKMEPSESARGEDYDADEDSDFVIRSTVERNDKEPDEDRTGTHTHVDSTPSGTNGLEQSTPSPDQSIGLSAAALAAIQAAQAQAEAMIELPNYSFPEKDSKKKKKKKNKDERKPKKEKKRKKPRSVDKDAD